LVNINDTVVIKTERLAISGGGGGDGTSIAKTSLAISDPEQKQFKRYFTKDASSAILRMVVTPNVVLEGNGINKITYQIGSIATITDEEFKDFGEIQLDISQYLS
jgi:hypothetical protein